MVKIVNELNRIQQDNIEMKKMIGFLFGVLSEKDFIVFNKENRQFELKK